MKLSESVISFLLWLILEYCVSLENWDMSSTYGVLIRDELPSVSNAVKARATVA